MSFVHGARCTFRDDGVVGARLYRPRSISTTMDQGEGVGSLSHRAPGDPCIPFKFPPLQLHYGGTPTIHVRCRDKVRQKPSRLDRVFPAILKLQGGGRGRPCDPPAKDSIQNNNRVETDGKKGADPELDVMCDGDPVIVEWLKGERG